MVEEPRDLVAVDRTGEFRGTYHVLQGAISPMDGIGPDELRIRELIDRLAPGEITEVVIATNPNVEGETTALYLARLIKPLGIRVTRIASGLPVGARSRVRRRGHARPGARRPSGHVAGGRQRRKSRHRVERNGTNQGVVEG